MRRSLPAIVAVIAGVVLACAAGAQPRLIVDCHTVAELAGRVAIFRDVGAPLPRVIEYVRRQNPAGPVARADEREAKRVYAEGKPPEDAALSAFKRCQERLGEITEGS